MAKKQAEVESSKPKEATKENYPKGLKAAMGELPHVQIAYVKGGAKGHWHFNKPLTRTEIGKKADGSVIYRTDPTPGYEIVYREDILPEEYQEENKGE
jgi:hypothetical protein